MKVWILTEEYNDYDQHGEYFVAVFKDKPTVNQIAEICGIYPELCEPILAGGGRQNKEYCWWWLREEECK